MVDIGASAPAPAPSTAITKVQEMLQSPAVKRLKLEAFVLITATLLGSMIILRSLRHRTGWSFTKWCLRASAYLSFHALSYVFGLFDEVNLLEGLVMVWAVFLVVLASATYNFASESLEDNEAMRKSFLWDKIIMSLWFLLLILFSYSSQHFWIALVVLWIVHLLQLGERRLALISACRTRFGLDRVAMVVAEFMKKERNVDYKTPQNPSTMQGYTYLVGVKAALDQVASIYPPSHEKELDLDKIATLESIWHSEGSLLSETSDPDGNLKDMCLSFALFWLLLRRFSDFKLYELSTEESREKTWNFVRHGLIQEQDDGEECERAFRVVEVELQFLYDYFYNSYFATYSRGARFLLLRAIVLVLYFCVAFITLRQLNAIKKGLDPNYDKHNTQITVSKVIILTISAVELVHIVNIITSKWNKVKWLCSYVEQTWWKTRWGRFKEACLNILCRAPCFIPCFGAWQRKLHQYSLLDSYGHTPISLRFRRILEGYFELPIVGQENKNPIKLSKEVKKAVILSLQTNGRKLSNGVASLHRNNVEDSLSWVFKNNESSTRVVLIWHIATTMCEISSNASGSNLTDASNLAVNFHVATSLSRYCAYLVAIAPKLLPDPVYVSQWLFEEAVIEARKEFKGCRSVKSQYEKLMSMSEESNRSTTLEQGAALGKHLIFGIQDASLRWKALADFWAEIIVYLAPSENVAAHAQYLVTGGEFITHIWALLTHAGVVHRDGLV